MVPMPTGIVFVMVVALAAVLLLGKAFARSVWCPGVAGGSATRRLYREEVFFVMGPMLSGFVVQVRFPVVHCM